jgi:sulfite reductase (NADPH) flavoprotein alpha-component
MIWPAAPLDAAQAIELQRVIATLNPAQRMWLSGYLAGSLCGAPKPASETVASGRPIATILFGSHSGNCERLAKQLRDALSQLGMNVVTLDMLDCRKNHLQEAQNLFVLVSTHGEGDPPERAIPLYELLHGRKAPQLNHAQFSVLALGDSSYEKFCETGRRFDVRLEALGARRLSPITECDVDFEPSAGQWISGVVGKLAREHSASPLIDISAPPRVSASIATAYTRKNPFAAPALANQRLTARNSTKDVRHIELSIEGSGIHYEPGDALGIVPRNRIADVAELIDALQFDGESAVTVGGQSTSLRTALIEQLDIGLLTRSLLQRYATSAAPALTALFEPERQADLERFLRGRHLIDLVVEHRPLDIEPSMFAQLLRPLAPRLYSIASSPRATPDEVHLTVSRVTYESFGRTRRGIVSDALADLTDADAIAYVYPHRNPAFRLPVNADTPIVMIGPGTGVAPFRAFLAEREAIGASGRNWLFFGDRSFHADFLYQTEWLDWRKRGLLRIDVAFSRDTSQKVYVQHRMREQGAELFAWLQAGAHIYVCGDAQFMAPDVERALLEVIQQHGGQSSEQAAEYLLQLQRERRYQKDVY